VRFYVLIIVAFLGTAPAAWAKPGYCHSTNCDPHQWVWYPHTPPGTTFGRDVRLSANGTWIDRDGNHVWANEGTQRSAVISMNNTDQHNGEIAYQTAYDSYRYGKSNGLNKVQHVKNGGRWTQKITTGDGIIIFKDQTGNVAVQTPDGRWHVTDARGEYASSGLDLERDLPSKTMVASKDAKKPAADGRKLASVSDKAETAEAPAEEAKSETPEAAAPVPAVTEEASAMAAAPSAAPATAAAAPEAAVVPAAAVPAAQVPLMPVNLTTAAVTPAIAAAPAATAAAPDARALASAAPAAAAPPVAASLAPTAMPATTLAPAPAEIAKPASK
jgi:hypothetical protein